MILAVEARARAGRDLVATCGIVETPGGAVNVVAGRARLTLDVRSPDDGERRMAVADIERLVAEVAASRGVTASVDLPYDAPAAPCDPGLSEAIARAVAKNGIAPLHLPSGAGHDGMALRGKIPMAMLFVRCRGGISHNPAEYASPEDMGLAAQVLFDLLQDLASQPS
jgi:allantoate deiminase